MYFLREGYHRNYAQALAPQLHAKPELRMDEIKSEVDYGGGTGKSVSSQMSQTTMGSNDLLKLGFGAGGPGTGKKSTGKSQSSQPLELDKGGQDARLKEIDEVMEFEKVKRKRGSEKNLKSYFFYLVFDLKTRLFPEDSLARYVQIS